MRARRALPSAGSLPKEAASLPKASGPFAAPVASASGGAQTRTPRGGATPRALDAPLPFLGRAMLELSAEAKAKGARAGLPLSRNQINAPKIPGQCVGAARNNACPLPTQGGAATWLPALGAHPSGARGPASPRVRRRGRNQSPTLKNTNPIYFRAGFKNFLIVVKTHKMYHRKHF